MTAVAVRRRKRRKSVRRVVEVGRGRQVERGDDGWRRSTARGGLALFAAGRREVHRSPKRSLGAGGRNDGRSRVGGRR